MNQNRRLEPLPELEIDLSKRYETILLAAILIVSLTFVTPVLVSITGLLGFVLFTGFCGVVLWAGWTGRNDRLMACCSSGRAVDSRLVRVRILGPPIDKMNTLLPFMPLAGALVGAYSRLST